MRLPLLLLALIGAPITASAADLTVTFTGLEPKGVVNLVLVNSEDGYGGKAAPVGADRIAVTGPSASKTFTGLAPGRYAIKAFHDLDGDGKMGTNPFGIPTEPFAFSNNARGSMGPPKWDAAAFEVADGANVQTIAVD